MARIFLSHDTAPSRWIVEAASWFECNIDELRTKVQILLQSLPKKFLLAIGRGRNVKKDLIVLRWLISLLLDSMAVPWRPPAPTLESSWFSLGLISQQHNQQQQKNPY